MKLLISFPKAKPRTAQSIAERILAMYAAYEHTQDKNVISPSNWVTEHQIVNHLTPAENYFLFHTPDPTPWQSGEYAWRLEGTVPLLWALGLIKECPEIDEIGDFKKMKAIFKNAIKNPTDFIAQAKARPFKEINVAAKRFRQQHKKLLLNHILNDHCVRGIIEFNAKEWHRAFNWLTNPNCTWDTVRIDD